MSLDFNANETQRRFAAVELTKILIQETEDLFDNLAKELIELGYKEADIVYKRKAYLYAPGNIPALLVAHLDTVLFFPPQNITTDKDCHLLWDDKKGLGADDRAGVWAVMDILRHSNLRPHILFTDEEEIGCQGAWQAAIDLPRPDVNFLFQMDRKGSNDCVFYCCKNATALNYVKRYDFKFSIGSNSDVGVLMPAWNIAGVNLSAGYYANHSSQETLCLRQAISTRLRIEKMLLDLPDKCWEIENDGAVKWTAEAIRKRKENPNGYHLSRYYPGLSPDDWRKKDDESYTDYAYHQYHGSGSYHNALPYHYHSKADQPQPPTTPSAPPSTRPSGLPSEWALSKMRNEGRCPVCYRNVTYYFTSTIGCHSCRGIYLPFAGNNA